MKADSQNTKIDLRSDEYFMRQALEQACMAYDHGEVPIGAVIVSKDRIIGKGYNQTEALQDVTAHAEMIALTAAQNALGAKVLPDCTLYVTIEPCVMCAGAIRWARLKRVVWGAPEAKCGFVQFNPEILHPKTEVTKGVLKDDAAQLMMDFFSARRRS
ncbi:MAG: nucleoside deaminase [Porphyromonas sp.]|nr:nucleoside deaminase [Porphyromonas sp.]